MRRLALLAVVLLVASAACAGAQSWFWFMDGSTSPTSVLTSEGNVGWAYNGGGGGVSVTSVVIAGDNKALRIEDGSTVNKPRWDANNMGLKDGVSVGMTVAFGIKGISADGAGDYTVLQFTTLPLGATTQRMKIQFKVGMRDGHMVLFNADNSTPYWTIDDTFHNFWVKMSWDGSNNTIRVFKDGNLEQSYTKNSSTTGGKIGVDSGGGMASYDLDYLGYSLDGAWDPEDLPVVPFFISAGPDVATAPDGSSATISWETNLPATSSEVHYGLDASCSSVVTSTVGGTCQQVTIPISPDGSYYYYVVSNATGYLPALSGVRRFTNYVVNENIDNGGFEDRVLTPWVLYNPFDGLHPNNDFSVPALSGSYWAGAVSSYSHKDHGGLYQIVGTVPGRFYVVRAHIWTRRQAGAEQDPSQSLNDACRVGIDPAGGTYVGGWNGLEWVENPNIAWSPWAESDQSNTDTTSGPGGPWKAISAGFKATGTTATVYLQAQQMYGIAWNITAFDDVTMEPAPPPPAEIGPAKLVPDGWPADLIGKVVTASWPDEKRFYIEESDRSAGILVQTVSVEQVPAAGALANVSGYMASTSAGQRFIQATEVSSIPGGTAPAPLGMVGKSVGKANAGLLCTVWGRVMEDPMNPGVAEIIPDEYGRPTYDPYGAFYRQHMYIDDGSGVPGAFYYTSDENGQWNAIGAYKGIKVYYHAGPGVSPYYPEIGDYVMCTGVAGIEISDSNFTQDGGDLTTVRTIELRRNDYVGPNNFTDLLVVPQ